MEIIMIAAMAANRVIGRQLTIPWDLPGELAHFKRRTWGYPLIMGRKTFESIGRALPGRRNIVISRNTNFQAPGCELAQSLDAALALCRDSDKVFVIGGEQLYAQALPLADTIILTTLEREVAGDAFFPAFEQDFDPVSSESIVEPETYSIEVYRRKRRKG
jgi:dihydrofolate reductase